MDFRFILTQLVDIFLYFSAPLGLVILTTIPFENAFLASPRVSNLEHFRHVLWTSFQVRFVSDFVPFLKQFGAPFGTIFQKKTLPKIASKKVTLCLKFRDYHRVLVAPRDAASRAHFSNRNNSSSSNSCSISARVRIVARIRVQV